MRIIFDLDDTLCNTYNLYNSRLNWAYGRARFYGYEGTEKEFRKIFQIVDVAGLKKDGAIVVTRFGNTLANTIEESTGVVLSEKERRAIMSIGLSVKGETPKIFPSTIEVLSRLCDDGDQMWIYTSGDTEIQKSRVKSLDIERFFQGVVVTPLKTGETLKKNFGHMPDAVVIGNSPRFDILPAIENNMTAIQVCEMPIWKFDHVRIDKKLYPPSVKLKKVPDLIRQIKENRAYEADEILSEV